MTPLMSRLGLGSAQFGQSNGAPRARAPEVETREVLGIAARAGLSALDVSSLFGQGEALLGQVLPRPNPFKVVVGAARGDRGPEFVEAEARATLRRMGLERAYAFVAPSAGDLFSPSGPALWQAMRSMKDAGLFEKIGFAAHASDDPVGLARRFRPDLVQAPVSLLDQRLLSNGALNQLAGMGIEVQLRSIFLNGLLFLPPDRVPAACGSAAHRLSRVRRMIAEGRSDPLQAALGFALSRPEASTVLVGVASAAELSAVIAAASSPPPVLDWDNMAIDDPVALDPGRWAAA